MTERKPPGVSYESWVDRQIREAAERGAFTDLPGAGKPLPGKGEPYDENWWVKRKLEQEKVSFLPPSLQLRRDVEQAHEQALSARTEAEARQVLEAINERIRESHRFTPAGPPVLLRVFDVEGVLRERAS